MLMLMEANAATVDKLISGETHIAGTRQFECWGRIWAHGQ